MHTTRQISYLMPTNPKNVKNPQQRLVGIQPMFVCIDSGMLKSIPTDNNNDHPHTAEIKQWSAGMRQLGNTAYVPDMPAVLSLDYL